jgi:hypothetical protein
MALGGSARPHPGRWASRAALLCPPCARNATLASRLPFGAAKPAPGGRRLTFCPKPPQLSSATTLGSRSMHLSDIVLAGVVVGTILGAFVYLAV